METNYVFHRLCIVKEEDSPIFFSPFIRLRTHQMRQTNTFRPHGSHQA